MAVQDWELSYNGLTIGGWTDYDLTTFDGFEGFDVRTNDQVLPSIWGVQAGGDFVQPRSIVVGVQAFPELSAEAAAFETAFLPPAQMTPTELLPLVFKIPEQTERRIMCRVRRRTRTRSNGRLGAEMAQWLVQLDAPDPRVYASEESITVAGAYIVDSSSLEYTVSSGANFAFDYSTGSGADLAFDYSGTTGGGAAAVSNDGNVDTYPSFTFQTTATMSTWTIINDTTGEQALFAYALIPGHTIVADMAGVATGATNPPITLDGAANYAIWLVPRVPIRLVPGVNSIRFVVTSGTAAGSTATIAYRSAWL